MNLHTPLPFAARMDTDAPVLPNPVHTPASPGVKPGGLPSPGIGRPKRNPKPGIEPNVTPDPCFARLNRLA